MPKTWDSTTNSPRPKSSVEPEPTDENLDQFDAVITMLSELDWDVLWDAATDTERRTLLDEFLVRLDVFPDHLEVEIRGAGKLNVALHEVGLRNRSVEIDGVGGPNRAITYRPLATRRVASLVTALGLPGCQRTRLDRIKRWRSRSSVSWTKRYRSHERVRGVPET
jgi:hypothetical protein